MPAFINKLRKLLKRHWKIFAGFTITFIVLLPPTIYISFEMAFRGRPYPGVKVSPAFSIIYNKQISVGEFVFTPRDINVTVDWPETRKRIVAVGRNGNFIDNLTAKYSAYHHSVSIDPVINYDSGLLENFIVVTAEKINRPVVEPKFKLQDNKVTEFQPGSSGKQVDQELLKARILTAIFGGADYQTVEIPTSVIEPSIPAGEMTAENLGVKSLIGRGASTYKGSIPGRKHNVALTATKIDGALISPGAVFSFNDTVGDISRETGFQEAYVIKEGRTVLGDGGGVCQDSTTLFRAVLAAGLPVIERRAHAYRVSYYEQNSPPGFDATVYSPTTDFKFINDTPAYILIQAKADNPTSTLTIELWGTSDGRVATTTKPIITDQSPPPPDLYQDDPTLRSGQIKQVDWNAYGAKVKFDYHVERHGETLSHKTFLSNYRPWQAVFLRGTGG
ncbi:VanW family protein [Candidatus Collierbacteria bacterium]|nr:VanW family protein [Candidatus Collierbacteria bacterium]